MHSPQRGFLRVLADRFDVSRLGLSGRFYARRAGDDLAGIKPAPQLLATTIGSVLILLGAGCRDTAVKTYRIAKEHDVVAGHGAGAHAMPGETMNGAAVATKTAGAELTWTAPAHWQNKLGSAMRKGSYQIESGGVSADLAITAFPGDVGGEVANVNRWRGQLQLEAIGEREIAEAITRFEANALRVSHVDLVNGSQRMLAAFIPFDGATWFVKLTGPDALVAAEKESFVAFLKTVKPAVVSAPAHPPMTGLSSAPAMDGSVITKSEGPDLQWTAPSGWQPGAPNAMRKGSYRLAGEADAVAEVSITAFPGDVGGEVANVNRWRNQLGLPSAPADEVTATITHRDQGGLRVSVVEIASPPGPQAQRLIGAIVPFGEATWFFKLTGPDQVVAREKAAFLAFTETIHAP